MADPTGNGLVQVAFLHSDTVSYSWAASMRRLIARDTAGPRRLAKGGEPLNMRAGAGQLVPMRNYAVQLFLDKTPHEWLWFIDTDMGFQPTIVDKLLAAADPAERPVVGALCFALMFERYDGMDGMRTRIVPTLYRLGHEKQTGRASFSHYGEYPVGELVQVAATGAACLLLHRSALEKLRAEHGDSWFDQVRTDGGNVVGEDFSLCLRLNHAGIPVFVHTGVPTTHHKQVWLGEDDYINQLIADQVEPVQPAYPDLPVVVDLQASLQSLANDEHVHDGMLKLPADLDRYRQVIEATRPEVVIETGTHTGASARWFADQGLKVVTIDINPVHIDDPRIQVVTGDSTDPAVFADAVMAAGELGQRCMVVLDSDHSGPHVTAEIAMYGSCVSAGCYLVVEDGIFGYASEDLRAQHGLAEMIGSPLDAIAAELVGDPGWSRDLAVERLHPATHSPAGWWVRHG